VLSRTGAPVPPVAMPTAGVCPPTKELPWRIVLVCAVVTAERAVIVCEATTMGNALPPERRIASPLQPLTRLPVNASPDGAPAPWMPSRPHPAPPYDDQ